MKRLGVSLIVLILFVAAPSSSTAEELPFVLHGSLGFGKMLDDYAGDGSVGLGVGILYPLKDLPIAIGADLGFQILGSQSFSYPGAEFKATWGVIPVTAQGYLWIPASDEITFYGGPGIGIYSLRWKFESDTVYGKAEVSDSETKLGINGGAGFRFASPGSQIGFGLDAKLHVIFMSDDLDVNGDGVIDDEATAEVITFMGRIFFQ